MKYAYLSCICVVVVGCGLATRIVQVCEGSNPDPACPPARDSALSSDAGPDPDAGADSSALMVDAGPCALCAAQGLVCGTDGMSCVECVGDIDCDDEAMSRCVDNHCMSCQLDSECRHVTGLPACRESDGTCVECDVEPMADLALRNQHCLDATAPRCNDTTNKCSHCVTDSDCAHIDGRGVCDSGQCVECIAADESACGEFVCDVARRACSTEIRRNSVVECGECVSDSSCASGVCAQQTYPISADETVAVGFFCFKAKQMDPCAVRPFTTSFELTSVNGGTVEVCGLQTTTCPAYLQVEDFEGSLCRTSESCGVPSIANDSLCMQDSGGNLRCQTRCNFGDDCRRGSTCVAAGYCQL